MTRTNIVPPRELSNFEQVPVEFFNDYEPTLEAIQLNKQRISERAK